MSWLSIPSESHFSIANIPFGIISTSSDSTPRPAVAIGDHVLDLKAFAKGDGFSGSSDVQKHIDVFSQSSLNAFAALGRPVHRAVRSYLQDVLSKDTKHPQILKDNQKLQETALLKRSDVKNHLPLAIGDYTDFYAGKHHAYNVGCLFRGPDNALQPNYTHLPVAYHGRASSVVVSGTPIHRPWGQILRPGNKVPDLAPCERLDIELEMGMFICRENQMGHPVPVDEADDHIFGYVLMNDWSARDIQAWEYVPLGPFTAKNLGTSISPWVVLADALDGAKAAGIKNDNEILPYLKEKKENNMLDIDLEVEITTAAGNKNALSKTTSRNLLWSWPQMIAHHTITGCNLRPGDLLGSGTISGPDSGTEGSLLEQTKGGKVAIQLSNGEERKFIQNGDTLVLRGSWGSGDSKVGFGEVTGTILEPLPLCK
ncbi:fumarylacetoacetase [Fusarium flagelliforme]|uniref:Fumarylacetoacetase n=1 Tax=Fusarium flagelliforme TaxID=2675880 RepID=A0A395MS21_9HYPO|nr:fumarylacetoacetase [Fusarium flagelliforme]